MLSIILIFFPYLFSTTNNEIKSFLYKYGITKKLNNLNIDFVTLIITIIINKIITANEIVQ